MGLLSLYFRENVQNALKTDKKKRTKSTKTTLDESIAKDNDIDTAGDNSTEQEVGDKASDPAGSALETEANPATDSQVQKKRLRLSSIIPGCPGDSQAGRGKRKAKKTQKALAQQAASEEEASDGQVSGADKSAPSNRKTKPKGKSGKKDKAVAKLTEEQCEAATKAVLDETGQPCRKQRTQRKKQACDKPALPQLG
ncbi:TPA: hypothetical protein ACH3X1_012856 [Trebouxia sp. C0004]